MKINILILAAACLMFVYYNEVTSLQTYWFMFALLVVNMLVDWWRKDKAIDKLETQLHWLRMRNTELSTEVMASTARAEKLHKETINLRYKDERRNKSAQKKYESSSSTQTDNYRQTQQPVYDNGVEYSPTEVHTPDPAPVKEYHGSGGKFSGAGASLSWDTGSGTDTSPSSSGSNHTSSHSSSSSSHSGSDSSSPSYDSGGSSSGSYD